MPQTARDSCAAPQPDVDGSWTRIPEAPPAAREALPERLLALPSRAEGLSAIVRGANRSYGKTALNPGGALWEGAGRDRFCAFDREAGVIEVQAGATLAEILRVALPAGWFLPVLPGTSLATVGGAIANDVHGKNHHAQGSFGACVEAVEMLRSDRDGPFWASASEEPGLFSATLGGWGLTGAIATARLRLRPVSGSQMVVTSRRFGSLDEFFGLEAERLAAGDEHVVAWVDCMASGASLGRGLMLSGRHAEGGPPAALKARARTKLAVPAWTPGGLLSAPALRAFNALYWRQPLREQAREDALRWLFPLDAIAAWNRGYGPRGFYQWQGRFPLAVARDALAESLTQIARSGQGSFLAVLKSFGPKKTPAALTFAEEGTTLALDFPNRGIETLGLLARLDRVAFEAGGALYPAKDWRMGPEAFERSFPGWREWAKWRDPAFSSAFSRQTMGG
jgi:FAD/FMN-containing dehydrogenase